MSAPFCWQDKRVLRRIRESIEDYGSALAVYAALTVAASDMVAEEFQTTHKWLSNLSGFGIPTVKRRLKDLQRIKAAAVTTPTLRAPCTYRLLPFGDDCPTCNHRRTLGNGEPTLGHGEPAIAHGTGRAVTQIRRTEEQKGTPKPRSQSERISAEKRLTDLRQKQQRLKYGTSEHWQRVEHPERLTELRSVEDQIANLEEVLV